MNKDPSVNKFIMNRDASTIKIAEHGPVFGTNTNPNSPVIKQKLKKNLIIVENLNSLERSKN